MPITGAITIGTTWVKLLWYYGMQRQLSTCGWSVICATTTTTTYTGHDTCCVVSELYIFAIQTLAHLACHHEALYLRCDIVKTAQHTRHGQLDPCYHPERAWDIQQDGIRPFE